MSEQFEEMSPARKAMLEEILKGVPVIHPPKFSLEDRLEDAKKNIEREKELETLRQQNAECKDELLRWRVAARNASASIAGTDVSTPEKFQSAQVSACLALIDKNTQLTHQLQAEQALRERMRNQRDELVKGLWETRWVSDESDYQELVGRAAEIRSEEPESPADALQELLRQWNEVANELLSLCNTPEHNQDDKWWERYDKAHAALKALGDDTKSSEVGK